jgi:hypothetical protein
MENKMKKPVKSVIMLNKKGQLKDSAKIILSSYKKN